MAHPQENLLPCPYSVGSTFRLQVTPAVGPSFDAQITVVEAYTPFTVSPVMRVSLDYCPSNLAFLSSRLPAELVFKVYDRRFAHALREYYDLGPPTYEKEEHYHHYIASGKAPAGLNVIDQEIDKFGRFEDCPPGLLEHFIATKITPYFESECSVYQRLKSLQGRYIPRFYGSTRFREESSVPGLSLSVPGVLLEVVKGTSLATIDPRSIDVDAALKSALRIIDAYGALGVLNHDVRLGNFIVKSDSSVVMIDFAQARVRQDDESDVNWKRAKWSEDEEGCVGFEGMKKFGWPYVRSLKYLPPPEDDFCE